MRNRTIRAVLAGLLAGAWVAGWAQDAGSSLEIASGSGVVKRPMTFADLQRMKRVSDPQISPSGKWVMFSVTEVDLQKNTKVNHLWVAPMASDAGREPMSQNRDPSASSGQAIVHPPAKERQVTFWTEGESGGRFSPDGRQVLFVSADGGTSSQIYLAPWNDAQGTLGTPRRLTNVSTEADGAIWSPDSQRILFTSRVYPECSEGSSWLEEDNCDKRKDADAAANPVKAQVWDHLLYRHWNNYVGLKRSHVLVVSATDGNAVRDLTPREDIGDAEAPTFSLGGPLGYAWAPDSKEIAYVTNIDLVPAASTNNDVFTLRLDTPGARPLKVSMSLGSDDGPAYSPDGKWLAFRSQARAGYESDRFRLMLLDRETMKSTELLPKFDRWVDEFVWGHEFVPDHDAARIYFVSGNLGAAPIFRVKADGSDLEQLNLFGEYSDLQVAADGSTLVAGRMSISEPTTLVAIDLEKIFGLTDAGPLPSKIPPQYQPTSTDAAPKRDTEIELTHINNTLLSQLDLDRNVSEEGTFWFAGANARQVQGFIVKPPNFDETRKYPVKFLIHGGPQGAWGDAWSYRWNPELMAASGYVVVMVNPRGSTGYGQAFIDGVNGDWGGKAYVDLMKGLDYAEEHYPFIDKTRECALGASYGGYMANWILTHTDRFACIVTHDGMFNPQSAYGSTEEVWFSEWEFREPGGIVVSNGHTMRQTGDSGPAQPWNYVDKPVAQDPFRKWSPMLSIRNAKTPTLVIHSQRDYRLDVSEGLQLFTALQRMNVPSKMLYFPDEGHWVLKPQNSKLWYETVGDWCDRWTRTNTYSQDGFESRVMPVKRAGAGAKAGAKASKSVPDERMGESRPAEMGETQPLPEKPPAPPVAVAKAPERSAPPAVHTAPVVPPPAPVPAPALAENVPQGGAGHASFSITISTPNDEVPLGSDAQVNIALTNLSDRQILFAHRPGRNNPEFAFTIEVRNAAGRAVEETVYGREARLRQQTESRTVEYVQPGMAAVQTAHIARLVNLGRPGRYRVWVSRTDPVSHAVVRSNEVTLNVVP